MCVSYHGWIRCSLVLFGSVCCLHMVCVPVLFAGSGRLHAANLFAWDSNDSIAQCGTVNCWPYAMSGISNSCSRCACHECIHTCWRDTHVCASSDFFYQSIVESRVEHKNVKQYYKKANNKHCKGQGSCIGLFKWPCPARG